MSEYQLTSTPPLAGYDKRFGETRLAAPQDMALVSIALPLGEEEVAKKAIQSAYGIALPDIGKAGNPNDESILMRMAHDQALVLFPHPTPDAEPTVKAKLNGTVYTTDQTDVWSVLALDGPDAQRALERICPLDLHSDAFGEMDVARTVMEHLGVIILRTAPEAWLLMSASSSAGSFLHALETSIKNVT